MRKLILLLPLVGCANNPPQVCDREYREIPAAYLQECELPSAPLNNGELSEAFAAAFKCAEQGNRDKQRIRELETTP